MNTLDYILRKFDLQYDEDTRMPLQIPNIGRNQLADLFKELDFRVGVELGVANGFYSETLMKANPKLTLYGIDPYRPLKSYRDYTHRETFEKMKRDAHDKLDKYPTYHFIENLSQGALKDFADESIDFVYIDANHDFYNATVDIHTWSKKVRKGGIVSGHDYFKPRNEAAHVHVKQVLDGYTNAYQIRPWFVIGLDAKIPGMIRDNSRSWMWVK